MNTPFSTLCLRLRLKLFEDPRQVAGVVGRGAAGPSTLPAARCLWGTGGLCLVSVEGNREQAPVSWDGWDNI